MGMRIGAKLIYGCCYSELPEEIQDEVDEMLDDEELDCAIPYYDAPREDWVVGVVVNINGKTWHNSFKIIEGAWDTIPSCIHQKVECRMIISSDVR